MAKKIVLIAVGLSSAAIGASLLLVASPDYKGIFLLSVGASGSSAVAFWSLSRIVSGAAAISSLVAVALATLLTFYSISLFIFEVVK